MNPKTRPANIGRRGMLRNGESEANLVLFGHLTAEISVISLTVACEHFDSWREQAFT